MKRLGYKQFIEEYVRNFPHNTPIYTINIAEQLALHFGITMDQARALVNLNLPRIADACDLARYQKGIYYRATNTVFGKTKLNPAMINRDRYLERDGVVQGYETGAAFLNRVGLTTQIPKYKKYATNAFKHRGSRTDMKLQVVITKPKTQITEENQKYLQLLDAVENKDKIAFDVPNPEKIFQAYAQEKEIDLVQLFRYAGRYYNQETQLRTIQIFAAG